MQNTGISCLKATQCVRCSGEPLLFFEKMFFPTFSQPTKGPAMDVVDEQK